MSRALLALFLVASLVSGVLFFTPNYSAEYDEDFYDYQPYLQYDFHLHELNLKNYDENDTYEFSGSVYDTGGSSRRTGSCCTLWFLR